MIMAVVVVSVLLERMAGAMAHKTLVMVIVAAVRQWIKMMRVMMIAMAHVLLMIVPVVLIVWTVAVTVIMVRQ